MRRNSEAQLKKTSKNGDIVLLVETTGKAGEHKDLNGGGLEGCIFTLCIYDCINIYIYIYLYTSYDVLYIHILRDVCIVCR